MRTLEFYFKLSLNQIFSLESPFSCDSIGILRTACLYDQQPQLTANLAFCGSNYRPLSRARRVQLWMLQGDSTAALKDEASKGPWGVCLLQISSILRQLVTPPTSVTCRVGRLKAGPDTFCLHLFQASKESGNGSAMVFMSCFQSLGFINTAEAGKFGWWAFLMDLGPFELYVSYYKQPVWNW